MAQMMTESELRAAITEKATNDEEFRARLLDNPADAVNDAFEITIPPGYSLQVHEETRNEFHLILPPSASLSQEELAGVVGGHSNW